LSRFETGIKAKCATDYQNRFVGGVMNCARNMLISIPSRTCMTRDDYDFTWVLADDYDLPLGDYTAHLRPDGVILCKPEERAPIPPAQGTAVTFSIVKP
jgi:hypothetical protein